MSVTNGEFPVLESLHLSTETALIDMNLATRIFFSTYIVFLLAAASSAAQTPVRQPAGKTQKTITPSNTAAKPRITTSAPKSVERSANTGAPADRSKPANSAASDSRAHGANLKPSATSLRNTTAARPASVNNNPKHSAKGVTRATKKVAPIKAIEKVDVNWMTLEQALEKSKTDKRKIFVDVYTDWCGWCKHMDSTTFVSPAVANYLNKHYFAVKLNAEQTQDIMFKDKTYHFKKTGSRGHHELAALWLNNRLSFPTVVFLDENQNLIQPVPGYQDATKMEAIINYFGSDSHRKVPWETYEKNFAGEQK